MASYCRTHFSSIEYICNIVNRVKFRTHAVLGLERLHCTVTTQHISAPRLLQSRELMSISYLQFMYEEDWKRGECIETLTRKP
jgi:hypothetical protein